MVIFHELTMRNFLSYGNNVTRINLNVKEPTLIVGKNYDAAFDGQLDSNGAGKTTCLNAIMYALYGKPLSSIKMDKLINNINKKDMEVSIIFQIRDTFYKITRWRKMKGRGGDGVELLYRKNDANFDDEDTIHFTKDKTPDSISATNTKIKDIIGLPFDVCARIIVYSASYEPFLSLPVSHTSKANQKDIMEELCNITLVSKKAKLLNEQIKLDKRELENLITFEERLSREIERYETQLNNEIERQSNWVTENKSEIKALKHVRNQLEQIDFKTEEANITKLTDFNEKKSKLNIKKNKVNDDVELLTDNIESAIQWNDDNKKSIKKLKEEISDSEHLDFEFNRELFELLENIEDKLDTTIQSRKNSETKIKTSLKKLDKMSSEKEHLEDSKCPYCLQTYSDAKKKLKSLLSDISDLNSDVDDTKSKLSKKESKIKSLNKKIKKIKNELDFTSLSSLEKAETKLLNIKDRLNEKENESNPFTKNKSIDELENDLEIKKYELEKCLSKISKLDKKMSKVECEYDSLKELYEDKNKFDKIDSDIKKLKSSKNPYDDVVSDLSEIELDASKSDDINDLSSLIEHKQFLHKLLTKKDSFIRKSLLNENIPFLNSKLSYYLTKMGLPHKVEFTNEMTANIRQFDTDIDFANLSTGQKARINIALSFAFRDVLQKNHTKINFCILDECLDVGLSNVGVQLAAKMLKAVATENNLSMYVISHRDEISSMFPNTLEIELKNGFSNVKRGE